MTHSIPYSDWFPQREAYIAELSPAVERRRDRRSRGEAQAVEDFLWEYYGLRGGRLLAWSPGAHVLLEGAPEAWFPDKECFREERGGRMLDVDAFVAKRSSGLNWIGNLLQRSADQPPFFGCLGLHEWAMVYEEQDIRHTQLPLRLSHADTRALVEELPVRCSHFDAFRFFSQSARPLNQLQPSVENRAELEQPACLHANMDLFKWCQKLYPLVPSDLTLRCWRLAQTAREMDMRASPYDVSVYGLEAIRIETPEGRRQYVQEQKQIMEEAKPLRQELMDCLRRAECGVSNAE